MKSYTENNNDYLAFLAEWFGKDKRDLASNSKGYERLAYSKMSRHDLITALTGHATGNADPGSGKSFREALTETVLPFAVHRSQPVGAAIFPVNEDSISISVSTLMWMKTPTDLAWYLDTFGDPDPLGIAEMKRDVRSQEAANLKSIGFSKKRFRKLDQRLLSDDLPFVRRLSTPDDQDLSFQLMNTLGFFFPRPDELVLAVSECLKQPYWLFDSAFWSDINLALTEGGEGFVEDWWVNTESVAMNCRPLAPPFVVSLMNFLRCFTGKNLAVEKRFLRK